MRNKHTFCFFVLAWLAWVLATINLLGQNALIPTWISFLTMCVAISLRGRVSFKILLVLMALLAVDFSISWRYFLFCYSGDDSVAGYPNPQLKHKIEFFVVVINSRFVWLVGGFLAGKAVTFKETKTEIAPRSLAKGENEMK